MSNKLYIPSISTLDISVFYQDQPRIIEHESKCIPYKRHLTRQLLYTVNANCGAGKTYHAVEWAAKQALNDEKILFVQPTKELIKETRDQIIMRFPDCKNILEVIYSDDKHVKGNQSSSIVIEAMKSIFSAPSGIGKIILLTHSCFLQISKFYNKEEWNVIIDEIPDAFRTEELNISILHKWITPFLCLEETGSEYEILRCKKDLSSFRQLKDLARNKSRDAGLEILSSLSKDILSRNYDVYVRSESFLRLIDNKAKTKKFKIRSFTVLNSNAFKGFKKTIIMGADADKSLFSLLHRNSFSIQSFSEIESKIQQKKHSFKSPLSIFYLSDRDWSITLMQKEHTDGRTYLQHGILSVDNKFKGQDYIYSANKSQQKNITKISGTRVAGNPYGMNKYKSFLNVAILSAYNYVPEAYSFFEFFNISGNQVKEAKNNQAYYQIIMRTALRDTDNTLPIQVILPDKQSALWFKDKIDGQCKPQRLESMPNPPGSSVAGRPTGEEQSAALKKRKVRCRRLIKDLRELQVNKQFFFQDEKCPFNTFKKHKETNSFFKYHIPVQFIPDNWSPPCDNLLEYFSNEEELVEFLKESSKGRAKKEDSYLFNCTKFEDRLNQCGNRSKEEENIDYCYGIIGDVDGGDLSIDDFRYIFPDLRIYFFNTDSPHKNRFRFFIPTSIYLTSKVCKYIHKIIRRIIETSDKKFKRSSKKRGTNSGGPFHGIDSSAMNPTHFFYMPSKNRNNRSFFKRQEGNILDVIEFIEKWNLELDEYRCKGKVNSTIDSSKVYRSRIEVSETVIENAKLIYTQVEAGKGLRNLAYMRLGARLASLKLEEHDIYSILKEADYDGSRENKKQAESVIQSLKNYGRL